MAPASVSDRFAHRPDESTAESTTPSNGDLPPEWDDLTFPVSAVLPAIVFAAPGSGKTRRLVRAALDLLEAGVPGDQIVLTTFTRKAGEELQARLLERTYGTPLEREAQRVFAGTIDSYALRLLHAHQPTSQAYDLLGDTGPASAIRQLSGGQKKFNLWDLFPNPPDSYESVGDKVQRFRAHLDYVYNECIPLEEMRNSNPELAAAIQAYWDELDRRNKHDFGTVVRAVTDLVQRDPDVAQAESQKYFLVDEAQDLNTNQLRLIELLAGDRLNILMFADDDQQMYGWRGSDPEYLYDALDRLDANAYTLGKNWRSTDRVLKPAKQLIEHNTGRYPKRLYGQDVPGEPSDVTYTECDSTQDEYQHILRCVNDAVGTTYRRPADHEAGGDDHTITYGDVLILVRGRTDAAVDLISFLRRHDVPVDATNILNVQRHPFGRLVINCLRRIVGESDQPKWSVGLKTERRIRSVLSNHYNLSEQEIDAFVERLLAFRSEYRAIDQDKDGPWEFAQKIFHAFVNSVVKEGWPGELDEEQNLILGVLSNAVRDFEDVTPRIGQRGLYWLTETLHHGDGLPNKSPATGASGAVRIYTVHNAKGLEADAVIMPFATDDSYPLIMSEDDGAWQWEDDMHPPYENTVEEERNLFYVGMTRARKFLHVSCAPTGDTSPSRFIEEAGLDDQDPADQSSTFVPAPASSQPDDDGLVTTMSDLKWAHGCGYRYKLAKEYGFEPGASTQIGYGGSVHIANQLNLDHFREHGAPIPKARFGDVVAEATHLPYAWGPLEADLREGIRDLSFTLYDKWKALPPRVLDTEIPFTVQLDQVTIVEGRIDTIIQLANDPRLWNMDLKTRHIDASDVDVDNDELAWDVLTQQVYHLGLQDVVEAEYDETLDGSQLYFARPDEHLPVPTSSHDLDQAAQEIEDMATDIRDDELEPNPSPDRCADCDLKLLCEHADPAATSGLQGHMQRLNT